MCCVSAARRRIAASSSSEREALDDRQHVVEVVGDAARELADGFHLLRLPQLRFELPLAGDVALMPSTEVILPSRSRSGAACVRSQRLTPVRPMTSNSSSALSRAITR